MSTGTFDPAFVPYTWVSFPPLISADPADGSGVLVTSSEGVNPPTVASFNVSNPATVAQVASAESIGSCQLPNGLAVAPGGTAFACDGASYSTADLSSQAFYGRDDVVGIAAVGSTINRRLMILTRETPTDSRSRNFPRCRRGAASN